MGNVHQPEHERKLAETCPVCRRLFLPATLASHVDDHLQHGKIELILGGSRPGLYIDGCLVRTPATRE